MDKQNLQSMSDQELLDYYKKIDKEVTHFDLYQQAMKILINSLYGALGTPSFRHYNIHMAEAITLSGQVMVKYIERRLNEYLGRKLGTTKDYVVAIDTDSCVYSTILSTNNGDIQIGDLFNNTNSPIEKTSSDNEVKKLNNTQILSYEDGKAVYKNGVYIMRHKVKKKMYRIKCGDNHVDVTEDHSVMIIRDGKLIEVKPMDIKKSDKIIKINN